jgi:hypothetical protein
MLVEKKGIYRARPIVSAVEEKESGTVFFNGSFRCTEILNSDGWHPLDGDQNIIARFNLIQKNGQPNEINVRALKDSLGWDGLSFSNLQREDWNGTECQLVIDEEEYEGKKQLKVQYINPRDYKPGKLEKADTQVIQSLDSKYGSLLRALSGRKSNGAPSVAPTSQVIGKDVAWSAFNRLVDDYGKDNPGDAWSKQRRIDTFRDLVRESADGKDPNALGPADWARIKAEIEKDFSPAAGSLLKF